MFKYHKAVYRLSKLDVQLLVRTVLEQKKSFYSENVILYNIGYPLKKEGKYLKN